MTTVLERLAGLAREQGGLLAEAVVSEPPGAAQGREPGAQGPAAPGALAAAGPRAAGAQKEYELLVEAIREGHLLHYGQGRVLRPSDADLALLAGDWLYAAGLARLAEFGDLVAVGELADVVALSAQAHVQGDPELAEAAWEAGAVAVGWGSNPGLLDAKRLGREGAPHAAAALRAAARQTVGNVALPSAP